MLKKLLQQYGKQKINSLTKYPSILTLHQLGDRGRLTTELTTRLSGEEMFATEKIDGTNVRLICLGGEYLIGSREFILHYGTDLFYDTAQGIVEGIKALQVSIPQTPELTVVYGELFGGKTSSNSKQYGTDQIGFRVFDIAVFPDISILEQSHEDISRWRERETAEGLVYGQQFLSMEALKQYSNVYELVPTVPFDLGDLSHSTILDNLRRFLPETLVALSDLAQKKPEGLVLRNRDRSKIVKLRFEDYERTLR